MDGFTQDAQGGQDENHTQDDTGSVGGEKWRRRNTFLPYERIKKRHLQRSISNILATFCVSRKTNDLIIIEDKFILAVFVSEQIVPQQI